jgi:hypothetical protein
MTAQVEVIFSGDTKSLDSAFRKTRGEADSFGRTVDGTSKKATGALGKLGGAAKGFGAGIIASIGVGAVGAVFDFGVETLKAFEAIETGQKRAETVFGDSVGMVRDFATSIDQFTGLSTNQVVALTASIGDILVPMGFARDRAAELSTGMVDLATKLSLASGVPIDQAINATTAAMVGEYDALKSLGVQLDAATVKSLLAAQGKGNLTGEAAKQAEAEAVLNEILRQTTDAQAQANAKMAEGGNKSAELSTTIANLKDKLTVSLGPALQEAAGFLTDVATALTTTDGDMSGLSESAKSTATAIQDTIGALKELWEWGQKAGSFLSSVDRYVGNAGAAVNRFFGGSAVNARANGGAIMGPTIVGERGPELLVPSGSGGGTIIPHGKAGYGTGGSTVVVNVAGSVVSERDLVEMVRRGLDRGGRRGQ